MILTFERPLSFRRHNASSSLDSGEAVIQCAGGCSHRSQLKKSAELDFSYLYLRIGRRLLSADVEGCLSLYAFGNVDGELDTIVAECSSRRSAIYRCTTVAAEDPRRLSACVSMVRVGNKYVALSCGIKGLEASATGASMSIDMVKPDF